MNQPLRDDIAAARATCNNMLARLDCIEGPEAAEIRAEVLTIVGNLESLIYWLDCVAVRSRYVKQGTFDLNDIAAPDEKTFYAPTLTKADVRHSIVDEYVLLRLDTANEQTWWRLSRENFFGLTEYLNDEARRLREQ